MSKRKLRVFLCHASQDKPVVREIYRQLLVEEWIDPWLDEERLLPGQNWDFEIEKAVEIADVIVVCLSCQSVTKQGYVQKEIKSALNVAFFMPEETIYIVPLRLDECSLPRSLQSIQYIDFFPSERRSWAYERLQKSLNLKLEQIMQRELDEKNETGFRKQVKEQGKNQIVKSKSPAPEQSEASTNDEFRETTRDADLSRMILGNIKFCRVPRGKFLMGTNQSYRPFFFPFIDLASDERPQHGVDIPYDYWISRFPITNKQYNDYIRAIGATHPVDNWEKKRDHPVMKISWGDADSYCQYLSIMLVNDLPQGFTVRLPTEAEWEKAARGTDGRIYPWGSQFDKGKQNTLRGGEDTTPVGSYSPMGDSPYGCADMLGNVREWTHSIMKPYPYQPFDGREDELPSDRRVFRGYCFSDLNIDRPGRCTDRYDSAKHLNNSERIGFRIVIAPPIDDIIQL